MSDTNKEKKTPDSKNLNPLLETPHLETREGAAGLKGQSHADADGWNALIQKHDPVKTVQGEAMNLKQGQGFGPIRMELAWDRPKPQGFLEKLKDKMGKGHNIDLDLGCLYALKDGSRGVVQPLGSIYGAYDEAPFVFLEGDDTSGASAGENLLVNGDHWADIERVVVYAYIYDGVPSWSKTNARLRLWMKGQDPLLVHLDKCTDGLAVCAVVKLVNQDGDMQVTNLNEYYPGHAELARAFGFGINWEQGRKDNA